MCSAVIAMQIHHVIVNRPAPETTTSSSSSSCCGQSRGNSNSFQSSAELRLRKGARPSRSPAPAPAAAPGSTSTNSVRLYVCLSVCHQLPTRRCLLLFVNLCFIFCVAFACFLILGSLAELFVDLLAFIFIHICPTV